MADWRFEIRDPPTPSGSWTDLPDFTDFDFKKEINTIWSLVATYQDSRPAPKTPLLFYNMETLTPDSKMKDLTGRGNHGTITGTTDVAGQVGRARSMPSQSSDYIIAPAGTFPTGVTKFTLAAWIKINDLVSSSGRVHTQWVVGGTNTCDNVAGGYIWCYNNADADADVVGLQAADGDANPIVLTWAVPLTDTNFHHYAFVIDLDTDTVILYFDGASQGSRSIAGSTISSTFLNTNDVDLGRDDCVTVHGLQGQYDEAYIYGRVLPSEEITQLYAATNLASRFVRGAEVRVRDNAASKEWFRGRIRDATSNEITYEWTINALDNVVLLYDRNWKSRREFSNIDTIAIVREVVSSPEGQPMIGQILRWDMESTYVDGAGTTKMRDHSTRSSHGAITGTTSIAGEWGKQQDFDVVGDKISILGSSAIDFTSQPYTIACFLTVGTFPGATAEFDIARKFATNRGFRFFAQRTSTTSVTLKLSIGDNVDTVTFSSAAISWAEGARKHVVVTYDNVNTCKFYVNGVVDSPATASQVINDPGTDFQCGGDFDAGTFQPCSVDELEVWKRVLGQTEVDIVGAFPPILQGGVGTVSSFTFMGFRVEGDTRLGMIESVARAVGGEWYVDRDGSDKDRINVVTSIGSALTDTFRFGETAQLVDRKIDIESVYNDVLVIGNAGANVLFCRNFHASLDRTTLTAQLSASATTATVASTTGFPSSGVLIIGAERVRYTGTTATTFTGLTRAYSDDGFPSVAAYVHESGIEAFLHVDEAAAPDVYLTPETPEDGTSIKKHGRRDRVYIDQFYHEQNGIDRTAQRLRDKFDEERESLMVDVYEDAIVADLGDTATINDETGAAFYNSPYRVVALTFNYQLRKWRLELSNYRDSFDRRVADTAETTDESSLFLGTVNVKGIGKYSATNGTLTAAVEGTVISMKATGIKAGMRVVVIAWAQITVGSDITEFTQRIRQSSDPATENAPLNYATEGNLEKWNGGVSTTGHISMMAVTTAPFDEPTYMYVCKTGPGGAIQASTVLQASIAVLAVG